MASVTEFQIQVEEAALTHIRERVAAYRWFPEPDGGAAGWAYGTEGATLRALQAHWLDTFDWRAAEADLNRFPHFKAEIDGLDVHFVHVIGEAGGKRPLLITHGWPGSVYEFWQSIPKLAFPSQYGGKAEDAFDLIIPSLPGYGWSGKPARPFGQRATAALWDKLMREVLGYDTYLT